MYVDSVFNFTGSKFKILDQIIPKFDYSKSNFIDLFTGGGSVYANISDKYENIYANDIIEDLILIQNELLKSDDIVSRVRELCPDRNDSSGFLNLRNSYNEFKTPEKLWALMLSSTNNMMRFNKKFQYNQTFGKRTFNKNTQNKIDKFIERVRPNFSKIKYSSLNFKDFPIMGDSMYYMDPPYGFIMSHDGNIGNTQISEAGYNAYYNKEDDLNLFNYLNKIDEVGSSFMISGLLEHGGEISWILNKLIEVGYKFLEINLDYNKVSRKSLDKKSKEIIIFNY